MLVTIQREQGLISKHNALEIKNYGKYDSLSGACGCGILDDGTVMGKYLGFENQIKGACATYRHWFNVFKADTPIEILDKDVKTSIPQSAITLSLLKYTPHILALKLTETIYKEYFGEWLNANPV